MLVSFNFLFSIIRYLLARKFFIVPCLSFLFVLSLSAQCPDRDFLWKKLIFIRDADTSSPDQQLKELLNYEEKIKDCPYRNDSTHAYLLQRIGVVYYKLADFLHAASYTNAAIAIINNNLAKPSINPNGLIDCYYNLKIYYDSLNQVIEKYAAIDSCLILAVNAKNITMDIMSILKMKVDHLYDIGDYQGSMENAKVGETLTKTYIHGKDSMESIIFFLLSEVKVLFVFGNYDAAEKLLSNKIAECKAIGATENMGIIYDKLGVVQFMKKNYKESLSFFQQAFNYEMKSEHYASSKTILNNIGYNIYYKHFNNADMALAAYRKALGIRTDKLEFKIDEIERINIINNIANIYAEKGLYDSSLKYFQQAFDQIKPGLNESGLLTTSVNDFIQYKKIDVLNDLMIDKANVYLKKYEATKQSEDFNHAMFIYKTADHFLDRIKTEQFELVSKLFWRKNTRRLYENAIEACFLHDDPVEALNFFERSRAVLLNDQVSQLSKISSDDILKQAKLKKKILQLQKAQNAIDSSTPKYADLQTEIFTSNHELERLEQIIKQKNPLYYQSFFDTSSVRLPYIQQNLLKEQQALVELFSGDSAVYSLIITPNKTNLNKIDKKDFDSTANVYISYLSNLSQLNRKFANYIETAHHLYDLIFRDNLIPPGRIIISPDGQYFPFESLITTASSPPVYFLNDHAVSYTYSARYLLNDFAVNTSHATGNFLGVAPIQYDSSFSLPSLQGSDLSLSKISPYFSETKNLLNDQATKNNFLEQYSKYAIIQLYTHASDSSRNQEPVIYFTDSALYLSELIAENKPFTRLIVLSACETGNGKLYQGEGVFSFNRGFASIGIPSSVSNLWAVDNQSTYQITELFYKYLSAGMPVDIALQKAKLEFMLHASKGNRLPYYWAASIVVGKTDPINYKKTYSWALEAFAGGLIAILSLLLIRNWWRHK